jgi:hypothetical protein
MAAASSAMGERTAFALATAQIVLICNGSLCNYAQASAMHNGGTARSPNRRLDHAA